MAVLKVIEVLSNSDKSWEDATKKAVKKVKPVKTTKKTKSVFKTKKAALKPTKKVIKKSK